MIRYEFDAGLSVYRPRIICDSCAEPIVGSGNAYWLVRPDGEVHSNVWHTHKYPCSRLDRTIAQTDGPGLVMSAELDVWLRQLQHNVTEAGRP
jgi:hypothetical protein